MASANSETALETLIGAIEDENMALRSGHIDRAVSLLGRKRQAADAFAGSTPPARAGLERLVLLLDENERLIGGALSAQRRLVELLLADHTTSTGGYGPDGQRDRATRATPAGIVIPGA